MLGEQLSVDVPNVRMNNYVDERQDIFLEVNPSHLVMDTRVLIQLEPVFIIDLCPLRVPILAIFKVEKSIIKILILFLLEKHISQFSGVFMPRIECHHARTELFESIAWQI